MLAWTAQQRMLQETTPKLLRSSLYSTDAYFNQVVILYQSNIILKTKVHHKNCRKRRRKFTESSWVRNDDIRQIHMSKADKQTKCSDVNHIPYGHNNLVQQMQRIKREGKVLGKMNAPEKVIKQYQEHWRGLESDKPQSKPSLLKTTKTNNHTNTTTTVVVVVLLLIIILITIIINGSHR